MSVEELWLPLLVAAAYLSGHAAFWWLKTQRARAWARKNGYRFVRGRSWFASLRAKEGEAYTFVVENEEGLHRTAVMEPSDIYWEDEGGPITLLNIAGHGWREPDDR